MIAKIGVIDRKYYDSDDFSSLDLRGSNFSLFHLNIASLSLHLDGLKTLLSNLEHDFNIIGINETKFQSTLPPINCDLTGYTFTHTPTEGDKGGALLYVSDKLQYIECSDLDGLMYI